MEPLWMIVGAARLAVTTARRLLWQPSAGVSIATQLRMPGGRPTLVVTLTSRVRHPLQLQAARLPVTMQWDQEPRLAVSGALAALRRLDEFSSPTLAYASDAGLTTDERWPLVLDYCGHSATVRFDLTRCIEQWAESDETVPPIGIIGRRLGAWCVEIETSKGVSRSRMHREAWHVVTRLLRDVQRRRHG